MALCTFCGLIRSNKHLRQGCLVDWTMGPYETFRISPIFGNERGIHEPNLFGPVPILTIPDSEPIKQPAAATSPSSVSPGRKKNQAHIFPPSHRHPSPRRSTAYQRSYTHRPQPRFQEPLQAIPGQKGSKRKRNTYSSGYSHVVTHRSTNPPVRSLSMPERTGWPVFCDLWPYVISMSW
jgi:hypothetical protein